MAVTRRGGEEGVLAFPLSEWLRVPRSIEHPGWDWSTKPESCDFEELNLILQESRKLGKALENLSRCIAVSDESDQDPRAYNSSLLRPRVIGEWIGREENDADPLAAEMLQPPVPKNKNEQWEGEDSSGSPAGRKGTIDKHLDSAVHKNKKIKLEVQARQLRNKQVTITGLFKKSTERGETRYVNTFELVEDFSATNIPIQGLVNEILQRFLMKTIPNCGAVPNSDTLRREHLPEAYAAHEEYLKWQNERFQVCLRCMRRGH
ncbi:UNVERIFIED_CONTAM: hypothetical protein FKN15_012815 [Acipenser sinensis]